MSNSNCEYCYLEGVTGIERMKYLKELDIVKYPSLGARMKEKYEYASKITLPVKTPIIIRIDGKTFHTFTRGCDKPFDNKLQRTFDKVCQYLMLNVQCVKLCYHQSDEISLVLSDMDTDKTEPWFNNNIQKIASVVASMTTAIFNKEYYKDTDELDYIPAMFDARVFSIPYEEVPNYFVWRMQDWKRNSVNMFARSMFSTKQLFRKNTDEVLQMCKEKGCPWEDIDDVWKYGTFYSLVKEIVDKNDTTKKSVSSIYITQAKMTYDELLIEFNNSHGGQIILSNE